ncbi:MFS transporter [Pedobacter sp. SYP-B3415]|uniref:MFS transporter n=1 Tax=Pedobacter sp. SYP-B3415 TaxID=2496641 RepID=UPI00101C4B25|nr:MFS transporter [Pedobacter sp. SYP-B3415]
MNAIINIYRLAYSGLTRDSWLLSLVMLINRCGTMVVPFLSIYCIRELHFSVGQAGILLGIFGIGAIIGSFIGGKLTDWLGFYDVQVGSMLIGGALFVMVSFLRSFEVMAAGILVLSICNEAVRPANTAAVAAYSAPEATTRAFSLNRLAINLGWSVGGGLGGLLASIDYHLIFWVDGITNIFAALMLLRLMPRRVQAGKKEHQPENTQEASPYRDGVFLIFMLFMLCYASCFVQFMVIQPVFYKLQWGFNEKFIGFLLALNGLIIVFIEMVLVQRLENRRHPLLYAVAGILLSALAFLCVNVLPPGKSNALVVVVLITFGEILAIPFITTFWVARTTVRNRGSYAGIFAMGWAAAQIIGPAAGGLVVERAGFPLLWWILFGLCLFTALAYYLLYHLRFRHWRAAAAAPDGQ